MRLVKGLQDAIYRRMAVGANVHLAHDVHIGPGSRLWAPRRLSVGQSCYIGRWCTIEADGSIGRGVLIANAVGIVGRLDHDFNKVGVPVREAPWIGDADYSRWGEQGDVEIGDDVWIGYGAIILSRARIGRGAIVAAGALVTHEIPPYEIWGGNPARRLGARFGPAEIEAHEEMLASRWGGRNTRLIANPD